MASPFTLLLADLVHPTNQHKTFPYAAGCVGAHAATVFGDRARVEIFRDTADLGDAFTRQPPALAGFTNYIWNLELTYEVIRRAKHIAPRTVIVVGGPNYPNDPDGQRAFHEQYPLIDFYIFKEGELPFVALVEALATVDFDAAALRAARPELPAVHYLDGGTLIAPGPAPRARELDGFASPYLSGLLDKFFGRRDLVPLLQTKRGCPFQCTFCVEGESYYTKLASVTTPRFRAELTYIAARIGDGPPLLHIADSNFGMYAHDLELCDAIAETRRTYGWPATVEVSTGKNRKERVLEAVARTGGAMRFGPALQTTDHQTLVNVKRDNISENILMEMAAAATAQDQRSYTELILGLPGETVASHARSIQAAMDAGMQRIKMYPLVLLPGTEMATPADRAQYGIETRFRVFPLCHGMHRFDGAPFPSVEIAELVIGTASMPFADYIAAKRFELSVEIFYNDFYLEEVHGLVRALGLSMFDIVERCHARYATFPASLQVIYEALERGVTDNLWDSRAACLAHFRTPGALQAYAAEEYKNSLGTLKAVALVEHIEPILKVAAQALHAAVAAAGRSNALLTQYIDELMEYSRLRRQRILDHREHPEGTFRFAFDRIVEQAFAVEPSGFRLDQPRTMRFRHDAKQAHDLETLCAEEAHPVLRARSFIYPRTDPGFNPYLRRGAFC